MVYLDSWWPYILVGISFFAFFVLIAVLCRHRLRVCPRDRCDDNGRYPQTAIGDVALPVGPAMDQRPTAAVVGGGSGFHRVADLTTISGGGSPVDVIILPPPYSDQAPPSYNDAIKTHTGYHQTRTSGGQSVDPSRPR